MAVMKAINTYMPFLNIEGGKIPKRISLKAPPPTAVSVPKVITPSKSSRFLKATITPDIVKAIIPIISIINISIPNFTVLIIYQRKTDYFLAVCF